APNFFQAYFNLGVAYQEKGDAEKAREFLLKAKTMATDKTVQERIDQVLAQFSGGAPPASPAVSSPSSSTAVVAVDASLSPFQQAVEKLFRSHEIMGPRISRIEWSSPTTARVLFQNFPMSAMPAEVRERFLGKLRTQLTEARNTNNINNPVTIELVDADTNQVMD